MQFQQPLVRARFGSPLEKWLDRLSWGLFAASWVIMALREIQVLEWLSSQGWISPVFLALTGWMTVQALCKELPLQNALLAAGIIAVLGGAAHWLSQISGVPFGPISFGGARGQSPFQEWTTGAALLWVVGVLNARGVARRALRKRSNHPSHGLRVIALSAGLMVWFGLGLEPYGSEIHRYWLWGQTRLPVTWHGAPLTSLFGWGTISVVCLIAGTPALINKHPNPPEPSGWPVLIWVAINLLFLLAALGQGFMDVVIVVTLGLFWPVWLLVQWARALCAAPAEGRS